MGYQWYSSFCNFGIIGKRKHFFKLTLGVTLSSAPFIPRRTNRNLFGFNRYHQFLLDECMWMCNDEMLKPMLAAWNWISFIAFSIKSTLVLHLRLDMAIHKLHLHISYPYFLLKQFKIKVILGYVLPVFTSEELWIPKLTPIQFQHNLNEHGILNSFLKHLFFLMRTILYL